MKLVAMTLRVDPIEARAEVITAFDNRLGHFFEECGCMPLLMPNNDVLASALLLQCKPEAVILTGGGDTHFISGTSSTRDCIEAILINWAQQEKIPVIGICRGMQVLLGVDCHRLERIHGHAGTRHKISGGRSIEVNSFHKYGTKDKVPPFEVRATSSDGTVEYIADTNRKRYGIMWHPERENPLHQEGIALFQTWLELVKSKQ